MKIGCLDCSTTTIGRATRTDMVLATPLDAAMETVRLRQRLDPLPLSSCTPTSQAILRGALSAIHAALQLSEQQPHPHLRASEAVIEAGELLRRVNRRGLSIFHRLGDAEAQGRTASRSRQSTRPPLPPPVPT